MMKENLKIPSAPYNLRCELLTKPQLTEINTAKPQFSWCVPVGQMQKAYQITVSSKLSELTDKTADMWNSGEVFSSDSISIRYEGKPLRPHSEYYWCVRFRSADNIYSEWSKPQKFYVGNISTRYSIAIYPLEISEILPVDVIEKEQGHWFYDFGKAAFGTVSFCAETDCDNQIIVVHLGEALSSSATIDRKPKGTIRYRKIHIELRRGKHKYKIAIPSDERNTKDKRAILMPDYIGEVIPFRYCELEIPSKSQNTNITISEIKQLAVHYHFDDSASEFYSSDKILNQVWDLCKYSIKATSFCGIYVDGDRERIPYEGDAYINQLSHYSVDSEYSLARHTNEYLIFHPTWPTEWILTQVLMAWTDYMYTGDESFLREYYDDLKAKTLIALARDDGLISTKTGLVTQDVLDSIHASFEVNQLADLVDWPPKEFASYGQGERDNYEMMAVNTVVNAYHYRNLVLMSKIADVLGKKEDEHYFSNRSELVYRSFNRIFFDAKRKIYVDGEGCEHASLHSNMFALAFGLVPQEYVTSVADYVQSRGMACSVYGAQHLLDALYIAGRDRYALELMTSKTERSWYNMIKSGSTITLEAWDWKYKNNLDWNHAWGAAPANIIPRWLAGVQPLKPGFDEILIKPQIGNLKFFNIKVPTIRGTVNLELEIHKNQLALSLELPGNTFATIDLSGIFDEISCFTINGHSISKADNKICSVTIVSGKYQIKAIGSRKI